MRGVALAVAALLLGAAMTARAQAQNYPWCAVYDEGGPAYNCGFVTRQQCLATVQGVGGFCEQNLQYRPAFPPGRRAPDSYPVR